MNLIFLVLFIGYFIFLHKKVLAHFGLTERDNNLMWIGCLVPSAITNLFIFGVGCFTGQFLMTSLFFGALAAYFVYRSYAML